MLDITCRQCGAIYHADPAHLGKRLRCTQCSSIIVIENPQSAAVPLKAGDAQPREHSQDVSVNATFRKRSSRRAIYLGASALIVSSFAVWWWHSQPQVPVADQRGQVGSGVTQQSDIHESRPEQANSTARNVPPDTERKAVSNPFDKVPPDGKNSFAEAHSEQSHSASSVSANTLDPRPKHYHSLPSGTRLGDDIGVGGRGKLSISNRTNLDAVARLYDRSTLETVRWFFVKANGSVTVISIPQGDYVLAYTTGLDWVDSEDAFRWNPSYHEFETAINYSEQAETDGIRYHEISVTLHPVMGGNVRTKPISRADFLKGHRHDPM
jgi:hypothetical protein